MGADKIAGAPVAEWALAVHASVSTSIRTWARDRFAIRFYGDCGAAPSLACGLRGTPRIHARAIPVDP